MLRLWPDYCSAAVSDYLRRAGMTDQDLAEYLGITGHSVIRLRLCKLPKTIEETQAIAEFVGCVGYKLTGILGIGPPVPTWTLTESNTKPRKVRRRG